MGPRAAPESSPPETRRPRPEPTPRARERALADALTREQAALNKAAAATARLRASRREAAAATRELRALQALTDNALTHLSLDDLLRELLSRLQVIMRVDNAAILLLDERARILTVYAARGPEEGHVRQVHIPLGQGFSGRIAASRAPLIVNDLAHMDLVNPLLRETLRSVVGVPLLINERVLGVVHVGMARRRRFTTHDVELLQWAADRIAVGVERARLFEASQQARSQAADQAQELEELLQAMPDAVIVFDHLGRVRRMNSAARELLGLRADPEFYGQPLADRGYQATVSGEHGEPLAQDQWPFMRVLRGEALMGSDAVDIRYRVPGHVDVQVSVIGAPLRNARGQITGAVCVLRDVTERRQMEQREREAAQAQALALETANRQMNEFLSIASHELKTPVTIIKANLHLLEREQRRQHQPHEQTVANPPTESTRSQDLTTRARRGMDRLAHLVDDLLDVSRVQVGRLELQCVPCDLRAVVREVVVEVREAHPQRVIHLRETNCAVEMRADPDRLRQVVANYLTNALKYSPVDRPVLVRLSVEERTAHVAVDDEGPGIPPHEQDQLWQMYHRVPGIEVQAGSGVGLGLGLHICKTIVELHGGQVGVASTVGQGSTFWFTLPLDAAPDARTVADGA